MSQDGIKEILFFAIPIGGIVVVLAMVGLLIYIIAKRSGRK